MLKNASSLAIVGLDTAENGPSKVRQVTNRIDAIIGAQRALHRHEPVPFRAEFRVPAAGLLRAGARRPPLRRRAY